MSMSSRYKGKHKNLSELSSDNIDEGTSARTRPFSYEDIMLRRKNKNVVETQDKIVEVDKVEQIVSKSLYDESERNGRENPRSIRSTIVSVDSREVSSRTKDDNAYSLRESKLMKDTAVQSLDYKKRMSNSDKNNLTGDITRVKSDRHIDIKDGRHIDIKDGRYTDSRERRPNHHSKHASDERHLRDHSRKDISASRSTKKYDKDRSRNEPTHEDDRIGNKKRNTDLSSLDYEGQLKKRHSRDWIGKDSHRDSDRPQLDKAPKKKHVDVSEEKDREKDAKKLHSRPSRNLDLSEKNSERNRKNNPQTHYEEPIQQSKRPRRRGIDDERGRLQPSISSRGHRHSSAGNQEFEVSPTQPAKDRSEKDNPDVERKRISSNGTNRRYSGSSSGLGGYSPRKRKTEAAPKTPSSTNHSPEKRDPVSDLKHTEKDEDVIVPAVSDSQSSQIVSASEEKSLSVIPKTSDPVGPIISSHYISSSQLRAIDSIQLTQATRPKRRLYVENLPSSASEKTLMECINSFLLSSGVNYIQRTLPCISCIIHQDKGQALLEFLTPEDASAALSFDGRSFYGSTLKIRRPKDFIEVTTGGPDKSAEVANSISDLVENSSNKIFIGGISKLISSDMLIDIAKAFGPLKAFHFEHNAEMDAQVAFLEYADSLITIKACAGLNGMKLGGQVLTVVQAIPDTLLPRNDCHSSLYGIPENAKPLMENPTEVLKLKNVVDLEGLSSLSEAEVEELLEDIRLECTRFGRVTAVNIVTCSNDSSTVETSAAMDESVPMDENIGYKEEKLQTNADGSEGFDKSITPSSNTEPVQNNSNVGGDDKPGMGNTLSSWTEPNDNDQTRLSTGDPDDNPSVNNTIDETCGSPLQNEVLEAKGLSFDEKSSPLDQLVDTDKVSVASPVKVVAETAGQMNNSMDQLLLDNDKVYVSNETPNRVNMEDSRLEENTGRLDNNSGKNKSEASKGGEDSEVTEFWDMLETGCVLVEFKRAEASCTAAHCLHGRLFSDKIVAVEYVSPDIYRKRFPK